MLDSVSKTIGTEYETLVFDNREKQYGICKVYNETARKSKGDYLCFVHEDMVIESNGWGKELVKFAGQNSDCGVIGVAGGKSVPRNFYNWHSDSEYAIKIHDPTGSKKQNTIDKNDLGYLYKNPNNEIFSKVVCLDGVFLFVKKSVWENNTFDEMTFKGFHFYDADFTFSISQKYQNHVYFGMDLYHFSKGSMEKLFCENLSLFQKKWKQCMPYCLKGYKISFRQELGCARLVFSLYLKYGFTIESFKSIYRMNSILFFIIFFIQFIPNFLLRKCKNLIHIVFRCRPD